MTDTVTYSILETPFSLSGSWLCLSPVVAEHRTERDVHLVSHRIGLHPVLALSPHLDGRRVDTEIVATPESLTWRADGVRIEAAFEAVDTIRIRGRGASLHLDAATSTLTPFSGSYSFVDPVDGSLVHTSYETGHRYRITTVAGRTHVSGDQALGSADRRAVVAPDGSGDWEIAIEEFATSREPYVPASSFDEVRHRIGGEFSRFLDDVAPWRSDRTPAAALAAYVVWSATVDSAGFLRRPAVLMSKHWMDKVWSWDHCFNALALAGARPELALGQFLTPFDHQEPGGALPDSVTHSEVLHNFVKPPVHGWALRDLRRRLPGDLTADTLHEVYRRLSRWTRFWLDRRRAPGHALAHYQHGNDSGWDNATVFDAARVVETADLAAFLVLQLEVLAGLAAELGLVADSEEWTGLADGMLQALVEQLWDGDRFAAKDATTGALSHADSLLNLLPLVLGERLPAHIAGRLVARLPAHLTDWGLATEPVGSARYLPDGYWRGPVWAPSTVLLEDGLRRAGYAELADEVADRFLRLCERSGFAENFDAVSGAGLRDRAYTWTASAYLLLAGDREVRARAAASRG
ncbi:amylo-alpha-1,6-glucosidase [Nakamurella endophytica]|uniref:Mannosylglycerate hydrolase MGH1-like glycoside hydrolase domain-containing protein n=1 Tax=Nakamurella endophytica TaxID=1748367 RepID=A0A917STH8_9ACTN|nr:trehalase family glycosidase [Nakamurella endophytica]GGL96238.1 hypothetical protein GCM10011594_14970 [Nakamurella endophytica]